MDYTALFAPAIRRKAEKDKLLLDPAKMDRLIAATAGQFSTTTKKVKNVSRYPSKIAAIDAALPEGSAMKGFGEELRNRFSQELISPKNVNLSASDILKKTTANMLLSERDAEGLTRIERAHRDKLRADTSIMNLFGILGPDKSVKALPGYDVYRERVTGAPAKGEWMSPWESFAWGAGGSLLAAAGKKGLMAAGVRALPMIGKLAMGGNPWTAAVSAGLMAIPAFAGFDAVTNVLHKTDYMKAREGTLERLGVDLLLGGVIGAGGVMKGLTKGLAKAVEKDAIASSAIRLLQMDPTAARAIAAGKAAKYAKIEREGIDKILRDAAHPSKAFDKLTEMDAVSTLYDRGLLVPEEVDRVLKGFEEFKATGGKGLYEDFPSDIERRARKAAKLMGIDVRNIMPRLEPEPVIKKTTDPVSQLLMEIKKVKESSKSSGLSERIIARQKLTKERKQAIIDKKRVDRARPIAELVREQKEAAAVAQRIKREEEIAARVRKLREQKKTIVPKKTPPKPKKTEKVVQESFTIDKLERKPTAEILRMIRRKREIREDNIENSAEFKFLRKFMSKDEILLMTEPKEFKIGKGVSYIPPETTAKALTIKGTKDKLEGIGNVQFIAKLTREYGFRLKDAHKLVDDYRHGRITGEQVQAAIAKKVTEKQKLLTKEIGADIKRASEKGFEEYKLKDGTKFRIVPLTKDLYKKLLAGKKGPKWEPISRYRYARLVEDPTTGIWYLDSYGKLWEVRPPEANKGTLWTKTNKKSFRGGKLPADYIELLNRYEERAVEKGVIPKKEAKGDLIGIKTGKKLTPEEGRKLLAGKVKKRGLTSADVKKASGEITEAEPSFSKVGKDFVLWKGFREEVTLGDIFDKIKSGDKSLLSDLHAIKGTVSDAMFEDMLNPGQLYPRFMSETGTGKKEAKKLFKKYEKMYKQAQKGEGLYAVGKEKTKVEKEIDKLSRRTPQEIAEAVGLAPTKAGVKAAKLVDSIEAADKKVGALEKSLSILDANYKSGDMIDPETVKRIYGKEYKKNVSYDTLRKRIEKQLNSLNEKIISDSEKLKKMEEKGILQTLKEEDVKNLTPLESDAIQEIDYEEQVRKGLMSEEEAANAILEAAGDGRVVDLTKQLAGLIAAVSIPLLGLGLVNPDEADAGVLSELANSSIPRFLADKAVKASGGMKEKMAAHLKTFASEGYTFVPSKEGSKLVGPAQRVMSTAGFYASLGSEATINSIIKTTKKVMPGMSKMSPFTVMELLYKQGFSPAPEVAMTQGAIANMTVDRLRVLANIIKDVPAIKKEKALNTVIDEMAPLAKQFSGSVGAFRTAELRNKVLIPKLEGMIKALEKDGRKFKKFGPEIEKLQAEVDANKKVIADLAPDMDAFTTQWEAKVKDLAQRYSASRIALAVEDTAEFTEYPWLKGMLSQDEIDAVNYIKYMNLDYKKRLKEAGQDVIDRPYVHHVFHPDWDDKAVAEKLAEYGIEASGIPFSKFYRRAKYSKLMVPDITYIQQKYIMQMEKRLHWSNFWGRNKSDSWWKHRNSPIVKNSPALDKIWTQLEESMIPPADTTANRIANRYASFEVARLLAGSASVPLKHYFKNIGTIASIGIGPFMKHYTEAWKIAFRNTQDSPEVRWIFKKLNIKGRAKKDLLADAIKAHIAQYRRMNMIADLDFTAPIINKKGFWGAFDEFLRKINDVGSIPIRMIEHVDRTHTFLASLEMATKKGYTSKQALHAIYSNILKNNFLSGSLNPAWMRDPKIRALFLFQNTVFKITERRLIAAYYAGKDFIGTIGHVKKRIKNHEIPQLLREMADLGSAILKGEDNLKRNMIYDALTASKDVLGKSYTAQAMKEVILSGMILGAGGAVGLDLLPQVWHVPFQKHGATEPSLAVNPAITAIFTTMHKRDRDRKYSDEMNFWGTDFLQSYFKSTGYMNMTMWKIFRGIRKAEDDIPAIYKDSWLRYFFSVPAAEEE